MHIQNHAAWRHQLPVTLALLAPFNVLPSLGMDIYLPVIPLMPGILGTTASVVQLTLTLYMIMLGVGQIVFGPMSDRIGRRPVLLGGVALFTAASFALAAATSAPLFVGLRLAQAIGASAMLVALFATIRDIYGDRPESAAVYGLMNAILAFVPALGPIIGAVIADAAGWRGVFVALGLPAAVMLLWAVPGWRESRPSVAALSSRAFGPILASPAFRIYTLCFGTAMGSFFVFFSTAPRVLIERGGYSGLDFSLVFATVALVMIVTARFAKHCAARWGIGGCAMRGMVLLMAGALLLALGQLRLGPSFLAFIVPMWVIAIGIVLAISVTASGALRGFDDVAGTAVALHFCIQSLIVGAVGTVFAIGLPGDTAWPLVCYAGGMATVTLVGLALLMRREKRDDAP